MFLVGGKSYKELFVNQDSMFYAGRTDCGLKRATNQDHYLIADLSRSLRVESTSMNLDTPSRLCGGPLCQLFLVADGMGGHQAGNRASELAINYFVASLLNSVRWILQPDSGSEQRFLSDLKDILISAHQAIVADSNSQSKYKGMGTTLTAAYLVWPTMWIVHAGDTRCYLYRNQELRQLTRDHTMANQLLEQGAIAPEEASKSHWANILWNALGAGAKEVIADIYKADLIAGDRILLCSDGLNKHIDDKTICMVLQETCDADEACKRLIDLANESGGTDNITTIVINCVSPPHRRLLATVTPTVEIEPIMEDLDRFDSRSSDQSTVDSVDPSLGKQPTESPRKNDDDDQPSEVDTIDF